MRFSKCLLLPLVLTLLLSVSGCSAQQGRTDIQASVVEGDGFRVSENGHWIEPGSDTSFLLYPEAGLEVMSVDYPGRYTIEPYGAGTKLELFDVQYPTRVSVQLSSYYRTITYEPNGGAQASGSAAPISLIYDLSVHKRPNTATALFVRDGYTLIGWNTAADGSGVPIGLGSRATVEEDGLTLYAQWALWTEAAHFSRIIKNGEAAITGYFGAESHIVIPARLDGCPVGKICTGAFANVDAELVILPDTLRGIEDTGFSNCRLGSLMVFDNIEHISDYSFEMVNGPHTLRINAAEDPYGYSYRRESVYADKVDMLVAAQGKRKLVFYGGCSMWYNLIGRNVQEQLGEDYTVINMGLNGVCSSLIQMEILEHFLEAGDILFHTPELSSREQLLLFTDMHDGDDKIWCGLEYNYDLLRLVDLTGMEGVFDSWQSWLERKKPGGDYEDVYQDSHGRPFLDPTGSLPFELHEHKDELADKVSLNPIYLADGLPVLLDKYQDYADKGVRVYVSYACVNVDRLPEGDEDNAALMDKQFREIIGASNNAKLISTLSDYFYRDMDYYDSVYHLRTPAAQRNTELWLRDLIAQMERDGLL